MKKPFLCSVMLVSLVLLIPAISCDKSKPIEICNNSIDDDEDAFIDCDDADCAENLICKVEICNNAIDDDGDTFVDCADGDCFDEVDCD